MYNSDLASDIEKAVQDALATSDFSKLNKNITTAVNTSIARSLTDCVIVRKDFWEKN